MEVTQAHGLTGVLDAMADGIYIVNDDYVVEFMNKAMIRVFGDGLGKKCHEVINHTPAPCPWCRAPEVFDNRRNVHEEVYVPMVDKTYDLLEIPIHNTDGSISKLSIYRDITHSKDQEYRLKTSRESFRSLFEHVAVGIYISSKEGKFLDANPALLDMLGYEDKDEFLERLDNDAAFRTSVTAILHQGACSATTEWDGRYMMKNNYAYSQSLLHHCLDNKIPYIYASSAAVYGASQTFVESVDNELPLNVYGYSKLQFDRYVRRVVPEPPSQVVGLRYFNVYGPREAHKGSMASVAFHLNRQILEEGEARLFEGSAEFDAGERAGRDGSRRGSSRPLAPVGRPHVAGPGGRWRERPAPGPAGEAAACAAGR